MKIVHMHDHSPMFEMDKAEREVAIAALKHYLARNTNETASRMLKDIEQIDLALEAMARVAAQEKR